MAGAPAGRRVAVTVALRPARDDDAQWLDGWLGQVALEVGYQLAESGAAWLLERARRDRDVRVRIIEHAGERAGVLAHRRGDDGRAVFELVAVPPERARSGHGLNAAAMAEEEMQRDGARIAFAPAPATHGIAVYFWIRLGYRPLLRGEWPCARDGVAWFARALG